MQKDEKLNNVLRKVALGFQVSETVEEFAEVDGELKLTKRKRTQKDIPPDLKAVQMLMAGGDGGLSNMSDEELETERLRLLVALKEQEGKQVKNAGQAGQVCVEIKNGAKRKPRAKPRKRVVRKKKEIQE